jgi:hypothetical protein
VDREFGTVGLRGRVGSLGDVIEPLWQHIPVSFTAFEGIITGRQDRQPLYAGPPPVCIAENVLCNRRGIGLRPVTVRSDRLKAYFTREELHLEVWLCEFQNTFQGKQRAVSHRVTRSSDHVFSTSPK